MPQSPSFLEAWRRRVAEHGWSPKVDLSDGAVVLGAGTVLATTHDAGEAGHDRLVALLATVYRGRIPAAAPAQIRKALAAWQKGDRFIAAAHLAYARLPALDANDAYCLSLADLALSGGMAPDCLLKELGYAELAATLRRYNPAQPRVPAGQGSRSGEWTSSDGVGSDHNSRTHPNTQLAANTTTDFDYACMKLKLDPIDAGNALHEAKEYLNLGGKAKCTFDLDTGDIFFDGEHIGNLRE